MSKPIDFEKIEDEAMQSVLETYIEQRNWNLVAITLSNYGGALYYRSAWFKEAVGKTLTFSI